MVCPSSGEVLSSAEPGLLGARGSCQGTFMGNAKHSPRLLRNCWATRESKAAHCQASVSRFPWHCSKFSARHLPHSWHPADETTDSPSPPGSSAPQARVCLHLAFKALPPLACIHCATSRLIFITLTPTCNSLCKNAFLTSFFPSAHHPAPPLPCWNLSCDDPHPPTPINIHS